MNELSKYIINNTDKLYTLFGNGESLELDADAAIEYAGTLPSSMQALFVGELLLSVIDAVGISPTVPAAILAIKNLEGSGDILA